LFLLIIPDELLVHRGLQPAGIVGFAAFLNSIGQYPPFISRRFEVNESIPTSMDAAWDV
jgi:hypothetical protein